MTTQTGKTTIALLEKTRKLSNNTKYSIAMYEHRFPEPPIDVESFEVIEVNTGGWMAKIGTVGWIVKVRGSLVERYLPQELVPTAQWCVKHLSEEMKGEQE